MKIFYVYEILFMYMKFFSYIWNIYFLYMKYVFIHIIFLQSINTKKENSNFQTSGRRQWEGTRHCFREFGKQVATFQIRLLCLTSDGFILIEGQSIILVDAQFDPRGPRLNHIIRLLVLPALLPPIQVFRKNFG